MVIMRELLFSVLFYYLVNNVFAANNFTFTYDMASRCKEHICRDGYTYKTFYELDSAERRPKNKEGVLEMHLAILAPSNGHILLSTTAEPLASDPVYEIVIGGGGNRFTELRRNMRFHAKQSMTTKDVLSPVEFRAFYIRISEDGVIELYKEGAELPILTYTDVNPLDIKYFSFASWSGIEAKFLYDCPAPGDFANETSPDSKEVKEKLSPAEALKKLKMQDRSSTTTPGPAVKVKIGSIISRVSYDSYYSKLTTDIAIIATWTDDEMAWSPDKFNNTHFLKFRQGEIWTPVFYIYNGDGIGKLVCKPTDPILMHSTGTVMSSFITTITTWCFSEKESDLNRMRRWPNEELECPIVIGAWEIHENISLSSMKRSKDFTTTFSEQETKIENDWKIDAEFEVAKWDKYNMSLIVEDTHQSDRLLITVKLTRKGATLNFVLYTPLFVLMIFVLLSFWNEPLQMSRVWFYAGCTIAVSALICYMNYLMPAYIVPTILELYVTTLMSVLVALLVQVAMMTAVVERLCKTSAVQALLGFSSFRVTFCLPAQKKCQNYESFNEGYASQEDDDSEVMVAPRNEAVQQMETEPSKYGDKEELAMAIDKIMFFVYSVMFSVMLGK